MDNNGMLGQVLGGLFGQAMNRGAGAGAGGGISSAPGPGLGGGLGGALGGVALGSILSGVLRNRQAGGVPGGAHPYGNRTALLVMLLPLAMRWVQKNGGLNAVLDRFRQQGLGRQAQSWVGTGKNDGIDGGAVEQVVGAGELQQMAQRLGVPEHEVAQAFAEIMPQMVDHLSPQGEVPQHADQVLDEGRRQLEQHIEDVQYREVNPS